MIYKEERKVSLFEILRTFSRNEIKEFEKFINSSFFQKRLKVSPEALNKLYVILKKYYPDFEEGKITKKKLFSQIYPGRDYNDAIMRNIFSVLTRLSEDYLSFSQFKKEAFEYKRNLLIELNGRKLDSRFERHKRNTVDLLENNRTNLNYFYNRHILRALSNDFNKVRKKPYDLQQEVNDFFHYFFAKSLDLYRDMAMDENIQNEKFEFIFLDRVLDYIKNNQSLIESSPLISILYYSLMLILNTDEKYYIKLKKLKSAYTKNLDLPTQYSIYASLSSFCIRMTNEGVVKYRKEIFELYNEMLAKDIHRITPYVPLYFFLSVVMNALELNELKWTEKFIEKYKKKLDPAHMEYAVNYCFAELYFAKEEFSSSLNHLSKINIELSQQKQQLKNLLLKIYVENGLIDEAYYLIDTSKHFLTRESRLPKSTKSSYFKFINYSSELLNAKIKPSQYKIDRLKARITEEKYFKNKNWLLEKANELADYNKKGR